MNSDIELPREIIELILCYCDVQTLSVAQHVNREWKEIIIYLDKKYKIWKRACFKDIPTPELLQYSGLFSIDWQIIYENRLLWKDIKQNITFNKPETFQTQHENKEIECIDVTNNYIGLGLSSGKVIIYHHNGNVYREFIDNLGNVIKSLHFVTDTELPTSIIINYFDLLVIYNLEISEESQLSTSVCDRVQNNEVFDVYRNFFCGISSLESHITIGKFMHHNQTLSHSIIASVPVNEINFNYLIHKQYTCMLSENTCLVLANNSVIVIERINADAPFIARQLMLMSSVDRGTYRGLLRDICVFNMDVLLTCDKGYKVQRAVCPQVIDLHILRENEDHSTRHFLPQKIFETVITCFQLHGNTLVIGTSAGWLYFYEINDHKSWEMIDLENDSCSLKMDASVGPIKQISVLEKRGQRVFYVTSAWDRICIVSGNKKNS